MKICYVGQELGISPHGTGGAENFIKRKIAEEELEASYLLISKSGVYRLQTPYTEREFLTTGGLAFAREVLSLRKQVVFAPVGLPVAHRLFLNFLYLLGLISITRLLFNYPTSNFKRLVYFFEAVACSSVVEYFSLRQRVYLDKILRMVPFRQVKFVRQEGIVSDVFKKSVAKKKDAFVISFVGRFDVEKGVYEVIELFRQLADIKNVELNFQYLLGYQPEIAKKALRESGLNEQENCTLVEVKKHNPKASSNEILAAEIMGKSDVFLQPYHVLNSAIEAPLLLYEAAAAECYIMSRDVPGIQEHLVGKHWLHKGPLNKFAPAARQKILDLINEKFGN